MSMAWILLTKLIVNLNHKNPFTGEGKSELYCWCLWVCFSFIFLLPLIFWYKGLCNGLGLLCADFFRLIRSKGKGKNCLKYVGKRFPYVAKVTPKNTDNILVILNLMLIVLVTRKSDIYNARNILVLNLAFSDLLAALTMPFTAIDALWHHWPLPPHSLLSCR